MKDNPKPVKVVSGCTCNHHLNCAANKPKSNRLKRPCPSPVY